MPGTTIQLLLVEQDFCGRINLNMTITDRRKADCWAIAQQNEWISPQVNAQGKPAKATKPRVREALKELIWVQAANFDTYEPSHGAARAVGGQDVLDAVIADAKRERAAFLSSFDEDDDYTCDTGLCHADDVCACS